jgi:nucleotide-binding universal stress UspA family protein
VTTEFKKIVVGVDGSSASRQALRWAVDLATPTGATVDAVAAWGHPAGFEWTVRTTNYGLVPLPERTTREEEQDAAQQTLADMADEIGPTQAGLAQRPVEGNPTDVLIEASKAADLLVLGRHGHNTVRDALLGSVTNHCIQHAQCPVVVVPPESTAD